jgi:hypothetical protein
MGEKHITVLTEEMIDAKLAALGKQSISYIDPMKMAAWSLERACSMVDNTVSPKTLDRAIAEGELSAFKVGAKVSVLPTDFLTWYKRHKK